MKCASSISLIAVASVSIIYFDQFTSGPPVRTRLLGLLFSVRCSLSVVVQLSLVLEMISIKYVP